MAKCSEEIQRTLILLEEFQSFEKTLTERPEEVGLYSLAVVDQ